MNDVTKNVRGSLNVFAQQQITVDEDTIHCMYDRAITKRDAERSLAKYEAKRKFLEFLDKAPTVQIKGVEYVRLELILDKLNKMVEVL